MKYQIASVSALAAIGMMASAVAADVTTSKPASKTSKAEAEFIILDVYKDGKIDQSIWIKSGRTTKDFKRRDKNKDGVIDKQEFIVSQAWCC